MSAVADRIMKRVRAKGRGWVFTPKHFIDFGTRGSVDMALSRLAQAGEVRRIGRGLYDYPQLHHKLGTLTPDAEMIALAVSAQSGDQLAPSATAAANGLGLSTQVQAKPSYATTGRTRVRMAAGRSITLKHSRAPVLVNASAMANGVVQLLASLGRNKVDADAIAHLSARLDDKDLQALLKGRRVMPGWMGDVVLRLNAHRRGATDAIRGGKNPPEGLS
ncbi:DUF6088 family protein [Novosphingobium olei]|uniref:Type IV toxin-antitoxin system AbiEi family antitoxin domain-containing protein n=1 Tax=Novosphingobium olei TaxID=2728851 RepID=A0A7Y0BTI8_9SPHN|nr:DUF6088 family protein [Novosphingobium olei]NML96314.1 type IV toxin-antitoxin system AbiEi family antitoxin domain-containing protein [Novosphingobium olei]